MKRFWLAAAAATMVSACGGGNPWLDDGAGTGTGTGSEIPAALLGDLESVTYDPVAQTLTVRGISLDNTVFSAVYSRKASLDVSGYEAYTSQNTALERHSTAFVKEIDGTRATIVVTGGQFQNFFGGSHYSRTGGFTPPAAPSGQVTYAGSYVGLLNIAGDGGDLLPITPGTPSAIRPTQAAEVTGRVLINADFADNRVNGIVYDRAIVDRPGIDISNQNIALVVADILADGTFVGVAQQENNSIGTYGGIFGGQNASVVAGTLYVSGHITQSNDAEEFGLFVLGQCNGPNADPTCNQPPPQP